MLYVPSFAGGFTSVTPDTWNICRPCNENQALKGSQRAVIGDVIIAPFSQSGGKVVVIGRTRLSDDIRLPSCKGV